MATAVGLVQSLASSIPQILSGESRLHGESCGMPRKMFMVDPILAYVVKEYSAKVVYVRVHHSLHGCANSP